MGILDLFNRTKTCEICGTNSKDILTVNGKESHIYCRNHLNLEFKKRFLESPLDMVINEFQPNATKYTGQVYGYYPVSELLTFHWTKEEKKILEQLLEAINRNELCADCKTNPISVLFVPSSTAPWNQYRAGPHEDFLKSGEMLCKECSYKRLEPKILSNNKNFADGGGLYAPYKESGYYTTTEL